MSESFGGGGGRRLRGGVLVAVAAAVRSHGGRLLGRCEIVLSIRHLTKYIAIINSVLSRAPRCLLSAKFLKDTELKS